MKRITLYMASVMALFLALTSCEDYLEQTNPNGPNTDIYWSNLDETQATLNGVYASLMDQNLLLIQRESYRTDMAFPGQRDRPLSKMLTWYTHLYNESEQYVNDKWAYCYRGIFRANQVIEGLSRLEGKVDEERWTEQMAQARFFRGLFHFYVHSTYNQGKVLIHDKYAASIDDLYKPVSSSEEVIEFFRKDLVYAYDHLDFAYETKGKVTKGAAATILGTSHLYQEEYNEAMVYFDDVISNPLYGYELVRDMNLLFTNAGEFNRESILEISYTLDFNLEYTQWQEESMVQKLSRYSSPTGASEFVPSAWLAWEYEREVMDATDPRNEITDKNGNTRLRTVPLRASAMMCLAKDLDTEYYMRPYAVYTDEEGNNGINKIFGKFSVGYFKQYTNHSSIDDEENLAGGTSWKSGKNVVVNRLGEVYMMMAECLMKTGNTQGALDYINDVRERWALQLLGTDDGSGRYDDYNYVADADSLWQRYMYIEKPLECSIEGHAMRFIDMRRWGITKSRFEDLAKQTWYIGDFTYIDPITEVEKTKPKCYLYKEEPAKVGLEYIEYTLAAENYKPSVHEYFPLPTDETLNNPFVSN
ncbi:RagB/SusD family nutrient uptake outer membrane protein [Labilibacter marinus]|uniref:RagB/SusD family nutrient uptake outer membrane protein n=1 Tax=Labilibacter marinus TaxID=1477105 RepID=UPI00094F8629|nr:RagB/SusD family nutrient uptake outer membrane protein [Labilibacter marinus]